MSQQKQEQSPMQTPKADEVEPEQEPTEFHSFMKLAAETRAKIWGYAAPEPAIVIQQESKSSLPLYTFCSFILSFSETKS